MHVERNKKEFIDVSENQTEWNCVCGRASAIFRFFIFRSQLHLSLVSLLVFFFVFVTFSFCEYFMDFELSRWHGKVSAAMESKNMRGIIPKKVMLAFI